MTNATHRAKTDAGNPHIRFDEGEVASAATPSRGSLLYKKLLILTCAAAAMLAPLVSSADTYQYIISGDPVAAATENSNSAVSGGKALVTDALTAVSATRSLEARFRTWCMSIGRALRSDDWVSGLKILIR